MPGLILLVPAVPTCPGLLLTQLCPSPLSPLPFGSDRPPKPTLKSISASASSSPDDCCWSGSEGRVPGISSGIHTLWGTRAASGQSPQLWDPLSQSLFVPSRVPALPRASACLKIPKAKHPCHPARPRATSGWDEESYWVVGSGLSKCLASSRDRCPGVGGGHSQEPCAPPAWLCGSSASSAGLILTLLGWELCLSWQGDRVTG